MKLFSNNRIKCLLLSFFFLVFTSILPFQPTTAAIKEHVDYLIIASPGLTQTVNPLLRHRQKQGFQTAIYETGEIFNKYPGTTKQDQLRSFLISKFEAWNLRYVVLIGDQKSIPYETFYPFYPRDSAEYENNIIASDFYYASIATPIDSNQNGYPGEFFSDKAISFHAEVRTGRIPFNNPYEVSIIINRIIQNETKLLQKKALLTSSILNYAQEETNQNAYILDRTDGASLTEAVYQDLLKPLSFETTRMSEKSGLEPSTYPAEYALKKKNFEYLLQKNVFDIVVWEGHGTSSSLVSKIWYKDKNSNKKSEKKEISEEIVLNTTSMENIGNDHNLFISGCCSNLSPTSSTNLGKEALLNGFGCFIGGTSVNWYSIDWNSLQDGGNQTLIYLIIRNIVLRNQSYGDALYNAIEECNEKYSVLGSFDYANYFAFNLFGDPASKLKPYFSRDFHASLDNNFKVSQIGENIYYRVSVDFSSLNETISINPINYNKTDFIVSIYPETLSSSGDFIVKIVPRSKIYPSHYSISLQLMSSSKSLFLSPRFTILPYGNNQRVFLNFPEWHLQPNQFFTIDIHAKDFVDADSCFIELSYDNQYLELQEESIQSGSFFSEDGVVPTIKTNLTGSVVDITVSRNRKRLGLSGDGTLASVTFKTKKNGFCNVLLNKAIYFNYNQQSNILETNNSKVTISNLGIYLEPKIPLLEKVSKRSYFNEGQTNGKKIWFLENDNDILLDKTGKMNFITHFSSTQRDNNIAWITKKENSYSQLRSYIQFNNVTSIQLWLQNYWAFINEEAVHLDSPPILFNDRTMVPLRFLADALQVKVTWDPNKQTILLNQGNKKILLQIGSSKATINNDGIVTIVKLDAPPMIVNQRTLVPIRFISETFQTDVSWNQKYNLISVTYISI